MLKVEAQTQYTIKESENGNIRNAITNLIQTNDDCRDILTFFNEDYTIGAVDISVSDYSVDALSAAIKDIKANLIDSYNEEYDLEEDDVELLNELLNTINLLNSLRKNGAKVNLLLVDE